MSALDNKTKLRYLESLSRHRFMIRAATEIRVMPHTISAARRRDADFDRAVRYYGVMGRGFCRGTLKALTGISKKDVAKVKTYMSKLRMSCRSP
jgi:hypothetical protein